MSPGHFDYSHELPSAMANVPPLAGYAMIRMLPPCHGDSMPPRFSLAKAGFPSLQRDSAPQKPLPLDILEQRAQTPCRHFEHHLGWCPYGMNCHFLHDYSRLRLSASSLGGSSDPSTSCPSLASSATSSPRGSPVPYTTYYPSLSAAVNPYANSVAATTPMSRIPYRISVPRTVGGTTYFPIRLDAARLGYVTPAGVEVFIGL